MEICENRLESFLNYLTFIDIKVFKKKKLNNKTPHEMTLAFFLKMLFSMRIVFLESTFLRRKNEKIKGAHNKFSITQIYYVYLPNRTQDRSVVGESECLSGFDDRREFHVARRGSVGAVREHDHARWGGRLSFSKQLEKNIFFLSNK